jgi:hypothetical protein
MQDYKELEITGQPEKLVSFIDKLSSIENNMGWQRSRLLEENLGRINPADNAWYCFSCDETKNRSAADLWLTHRSTEHLYVCNIVPKSNRRLSYESYNQIISSFEEFAAAEGAEANVSVIVSGGMLDIAEYLSPASLNLLLKFSNLANKSTGSSHPLDQKRWFEFLKEAHRESSRLTSYELNRWLVEEQHWTPDGASSLVSEYEQGRALLQFFEESES